MGGQIMPPVMGAVAFIMAETINVPYVEVVKAAVIPAMLYFVTAFWMVHLEAGRKGLLGLPKDECPDPWTPCARAGTCCCRWSAGVLLFSGYTPLFSGTVGLALTVVLIFGGGLDRAVRGWRCAAVLGRCWAWLCAGLLQIRHGIFAVVVGPLVATPTCAHRGPDALQTGRAGLVDGARHALPVGIACALVGVIIGIITLTGVATDLGRLRIISIGPKAACSWPVADHGDLPGAGHGHSRPFPTTSSPARWPRRRCWSWACR
jgi:TRAP-type uncharacterized transport system fused permease subunit